MDLQKAPKDAMREKRYLDWGYFDQNHFIKDFKYFTQVTPSQFFNLENKFSTQITNDHLDLDISSSRLK